ETRRAGFWGPARPAARKKSAAAGDEKECQDARTRQSVGVVRGGFFVASPGSRPNGSLPYGRGSAPPIERAGGQQLFLRKSIVSPLNRPPVSPEFELANRIPAGRITAIQRLKTFIVCGSDRVDR